MEIYPGFPAHDLIIEDDVVKGVITGDLGVAKDGHHKPDFQPGMELRGKYTLFAEGARGSLSKILGQRFGLHEGREPQKFGIGLKELWELAPDKHRKGLVVHGMGWPLENDTGGGLFMYHWGENYCSIGFVVHLNYSNPWLEPFSRIPARQDPSRHPPISRRRQARRLWRARHHRRRLPIGAEAGLSRRRADRLRRRLRESAAHQGQP